MSIQIIGSSGTVLDTDTNYNVLTTPGLSCQQCAGYFTLASAPASYVNQNMAIDTPLAWMYFLGTGNNKAYLTKFTLAISVVTVGSTAMVAGAIGLQRIQYLELYPTAIPIPNEQVQSPIRSRMISQSNNANIALTGAVFGTDVAWFRIPISLDPMGTQMYFVFEPTYPTVLGVKQGLSLRMKVRAPATQTWTYSYTAEWRET